jgi:undecaprenyl diphosphate synthase
MAWFSSFRAKAASGNPHSAVVSPAPVEAFGRVPQHVAIIMDGNGRWAQARHQPRTRGHQQGAESLRRTLRAAHEMGIRYLTVYAFSSENWKRPNDEVSELMGLLQLYLAREVEQLHSHGVRIRFIGSRAQLGDSIRQQLQAVEAKTAGNTSFHLTIAISYGARQEMVEAARTLAARVAAGELQADAINETMMEEALHTHDLPAPDLLIRTGGEHRLSNFLLWQSAYTELYFTQTLWPDFDRADLQLAVDDFARRERRFGATQAA